MNDLVSVIQLSKSYPKAGRIFGGGRVPVLQDINFTISPGECVGLIGESGSGKSTLARLILGLEKPDKNSGAVLWEGQPVQQWRKGNPGKVSVVFQDYLASVNPRYTVREIVGEPLLALGCTEGVEKQVDALLDKVNLASGLKGRYPHELSGGQVQRACIARAIATSPVFLVLDEAISSLDVSVQSQILELLQQLRLEMDMTYLFVAHDLQAVTYLCNRLLFLYKGKIVEESTVGRLAEVRHDYAQALLRSVIPFSVQDGQAADNS